MRLVITDIDRIKINEKDTVVIKDNGKIKNCIGCYSCWIRTPGRCAINDGYEDMGHMLSVCSQVVIISKCCYGSYSPFIKNVLDRSIPYMHADFELKNGRMRHKMRYDNSFQFTVYFYGAENESEKKTAQKLVKKNAFNFCAEDEKTIFLDRNWETEGLII